MKRIGLLAGWLVILLTGCQTDPVDDPVTATVNYWVERTSWSVASIPATDAWGIEPLRGRLRWYNPDERHAVLVHDVYPDREINLQARNILQSLILEFDPDSSSGHPERSWGGVMRYIAPEYANLSPPDYLEFMVHLPTSLPTVRLIVDLGIISEDALPNDTLDTEDFPRTPRMSPLYVGDGNGVLEPAEDMGLDHQFGTDPADSARWNGLDRPPVPSWDDWSHSSGSSDFSRINGTEYSRDDISGGYPNTEDLNRNTVLDRVNQYLSYCARLDTSNFFIVGGNPAKHWYHFRIPLVARSDQPEPYLHDVNGGSRDLFRFARIYLTGCTQSTRVELVDMQLTQDEHGRTFRQSHPENHD
jgi:hypothetical protein